MTIESIDPRALTDEQLRQAHEFHLVLAAERHPSDPPPTLAHTVSQYRGIPDFVTVHAWTVRDANHSTLAMAHIATLDFKENQHLGQFSIEVLPEARRGGIGRRLLENIVAAAAKQNRTLLMTGSTSAVPAATQFLHSIGAEVALESHINQLKLASLDASMLSDWTTQLADGFTAGEWLGVYPEESLAEVVELNALYNQIPRGNLAVNDFESTPERVRQQEASMLARGSERWTVFVRDHATQKIAGYTELYWNKERPWVVQQGITAVWPEFRGHKLGRYLKAAMLQKLTALRPEVTTVRTENADSNAAMLKINNALGFAPYLADYQWQVATEKARAAIVVG
jgi:mycothiol synthase